MEIEKNVLFYFKFNEKILKYYKLKLFIKRKYCKNRCHNIVNK